MPRNELQKTTTVTFFWPSLIYSFSVLFSYCDDQQDSLELFIYPPSNCYFLLSLTEGTVNASSITYIYSEDEPYELVDSSKISTQGSISVLQTDSLYHLLESNIDGFSTEDRQLRKYDGFQYRIVIGQRTFFPVDNDIVCMQDIARILSDCIHYEELGCHEYFDLLRLSD